MTEDIEEGEISSDEEGEIKGGHFESLINLSDQQVCAWAYADTWLHCWMIVMFR